MSIPDIGALIDVKDDATFAIEASLTRAEGRVDEVEAPNRARSC